MNRQVDERSAALREAVRPLYVQVKEFTANLLSPVTETREQAMAAWQAYQEEQRALGDEPTAGRRR